MKNIQSRFLEYVSFDTQSDGNSQTYPSTAKQFKLAEFLRDELTSLGIKDVTLTDKCYVYAKLPASPGLENVPGVGFIAHMDTSDAASGADVKVQIIHNWDGSPIVLGTSGLSVTPGKSLKGHTIITTDGTTLLGADDKAGIAIIVTALEKILNEKIPHGPLAVAFTPDEEIGGGTEFFDVDFFGVPYAYTVDGGAPELIESENFNAAGADIIFKGFSTHPGSSKNVMINAQKVAMEFDSMLPAWEVPAHTEHREGFYHLTHSCGNVSSAELHYILRDHDAELFEKRKKTILNIAEYLNGKYGANTVTVTIKEQYRNMAEIIARYPFLVEDAQKAIEKAGLVPRMSPIRGGTDGARLSFMGLPCPNLGYGGYRAHGETEYADVQGMESVVKILLNIIAAFTGK
ncbi:MAG: peptidase T [Lentisphaerae bacterium]|nr:peptidase T [Lentisphaerota bacterium]